MTELHADKVLILDFGSQYTQLIARRVRETGIYSEIHPYNMPPETLRAFKPSAIILSGGPESVAMNGGARATTLVLELGVPVLGICYGMQTMVAQLGGKISSTGVAEFGYAKARARGHSDLLKDIQDKTNNAGHSLLEVWMSHGDQVVEMPVGFKCIVSTENTPVAGIADDRRKLYGLQFHPEVTHTKQGAAIFRRFLHQIAGCRSDWNMGNFAENMVRQISQQTGRDQVILGLSGGVDSSVAAALLQQAIGDQLTCIFIDNGLLRLHEAEQIMTVFKQDMGVRVLPVDAKTRFLKSLAGVIDMEEKRKIIGKVFIEVFEEEANKLGGAKWLAQGTIYPDVIESAGLGNKADLIKTHHNVGGLPARMRLQLLEPLRQLFKDEVRQLGIQLGLPEAIVRRHPFPGPGLAVRILGEVRQEYAERLRQADAIYMEELHRHDLYHTVGQAFAVFLPIKAVGVVGDARKCEYVIALRAVETVDFMTASWARLPYEFLQMVANRIMNEVTGIARVTYDISSKPPATIEWG